MVKISHKNHIIFVGVSYRPPENTTREGEEFLDLLETHLEHILPLCKRTSLILTGDFNDRTHSWPSSHSDSGLGLAFYSLPDTFSLSQIVIEPTRNQNLLNLIITYNPRIVVNSGVLDPLDNLDHYPVFEII